MSLRATEGHGGPSPHSGSPAPSIALLPHQGTTAGNDARVEADEVHAAEEAGMLDLDAAVLDELQTRRPRDSTGLVALEAELNPEDLRSDLRRFFR